MNSAIVILLIALLAAIAGLAVHIVMTRLQDPEGVAERKKKVARNVKEKQRLEQREERAQRLGDAALRAVPVSRARLRTMKKNLQQAGMNITPGTFWALNLIAIIAGALIGAVLVTILSSFAPAIFSSVLQQILMIFAFIAMGAIVPRLIVSRKIKNRKEYIEASLPAILELLSVVVSAGQTIERGIKTVGMKADGPLAEEFRVVDADISMFGNSTAEALDKMSKRIDVPSVSLFCSSVVQSLNAGSPIGQVLRSQAKVATDNYYVKIEERSNKIRTKMIFPTIFLILPPIFIITLTPMVLQLLEQAPTIMMAVG